MDKAKIALIGSIAAAALLGFLLWQGYFTCHGFTAPTGVRLGWVIGTSC